MTTTNTPHPTRLIKLPEVLALTALSETEVYRRLAAGDFPKQIKLGARAVAWVESEINEWVANTIETGREA